MTAAGGLAVVTGGTRGIGLATAREFVHEGRPVVLIYRKDEGAALEAQRELEGIGGAVTLLQADLTEDAQPAVDAIIGLGLPVEVLVLNAAASAFKPLLEMKAHHIAKTFGVTVGAMLGLVSGLAPHLERGSSVITISSGDSMRYIPGHGLLGGAKAAMEVFTRYLAIELGDRGIRFNCVLPGPVETESARIWADSDSTDWAAFERRVAEASPMGRLARPEDIAAVIHLLTLPGAAWINGQVVVADGGMFFADRVFDGGAEGS